MRIKRIDGGWALAYEIHDDAGAPLRVLRVGGAYQSATYLDERWHELPFEYYRAFDTIFHAHHRDDVHVDNAKSRDRGAFDVSSVLVIGGGGCSYPKHLLMTRDDVSVDVVERDRRIARIARELFFVGELEDALLARGESDRFRMIVADGLDYLRSCERSYDAIVNDAFVGKSPARDLMEAPAIKLIKERLTVGGVYLMNFVVRDDDGSIGLFQDCIETLQEVFAHVHLLDASDAEFSDADNCIIIATDEDYAFDGAIMV